MGEIKPMTYEDYYDGFFNGRSSRRRSLLAPQVSISREELELLKAKTEKYEALVEVHKKVKTQNDRLLKELDDMKNDGRKFKELMEEKEKYLQSLLRARADFENYKKNSERENSRYKSYVMEKILKKLVSHYDDLERALNLVRVLENMEDVRNGLEIIVKNFEKILEEEGVRAMNAEGEIFDPYKHEALVVNEDCNDLQENTILEELDKGYYINDKILKPAKVRISKKSKMNIQTN